MRTLVGNARIFACEWVVMTMPSLNFVLQLKAIRYFCRLLLTWLGVCQVETRKSPSNWQGLIPQIHELRLPDFSREKGREKKRLSSFVFQPLPSLSSRNVNLSGR